MALNLKIIRLLNGEEMITEIVGEDKETLQIRNPVRIVIMPSKADPANPSIGLAPWAQFSDDKDFVLNKSAIITIMDPIAEFRNQYNGMFGGVLTPPSAKLIIPGT